MSDFGWLMLFLISIVIGVTVATIVQTIVGAPTF